MKASIIVCSRNRVDSLVETVESLVAMHFPAGVDLEIIVVDNGSGDGTAHHMREFAATAKVPVVVLEEPVAGKAFALNRALAAAQGEYLLFTDDDALIDRGWLNASLAAFAESGADCVGGQVIPHWLTARPDWLTDRFLNVLAMLDLGGSPRELTDELLYGVNYGFRRDVFDRLGTFDTRLCARGCGNEDREFVERLRAGGGRVWYDPRIVVRHKVFPERVTKAYFRRWYRLNGRDRAEVRRSRTTVLGIEGYMLRGLATAAARLALAAMRADRTEVFSQELNCRLYLAYGRARLAQFWKGRVPALQRAPVTLRHGGPEGGSVS